MELEQLIDLTTDPRRLKEKVMGEKPAIDSEKVKVWDVKHHPVMQEAKRPKKKINKTYMEDGVEKTTVDYVEVSRLPIPYQKRIVEASAAFLCGNPIELVANPASEVEKRLLEAVKTAWDNNKLDYESKKLAKMMMSECEVAELWFVDVKEGVKELKMTILPSYLGSALYPVFDQYGDLVAFGRSYKTTSEEGQQKEHFDIYTAEWNYFYETKFGLWAESKPKEKNINGKIPVIYYSQEDVEWADVQPLITRIETLQSNLADTNDYFGSPIVKFKGDVSGVGDKYEQGKAFKLEGENSDATYMTWDQSPASIELEHKLLRGAIMDFTSTPDISIEQMKSLGTYSGIALKMLFMSAHLKASDKEEVFGKSVQRRLNFIKSMLCELDQTLKPALKMSIKPKFTYYLPKNVQEEIELISLAKNNGMLSQESAIEQNPLVEDAEAEKDRIKKETEANKPTPKDKEDDNNEGAAGAGELVAA